MKILIADDEELVRVGLRDMLSEIVSSAEIFEAVNGRELISKVTEIRPEICFADIRMPGITGLEAIEQLADVYPDTGWIILSGYSDFSYARKALGLGVIDYLLKPATEDEVLLSLDKAAKRRAAILQRKREKFEYRIGGVINNSSAVEFDDYIINIGCYAAMVFISCSDDFHESFNLQRRLFSELRSVIDGASFDGYAGLFNILDGIPAVIAGGNNPAELLNEIRGELPVINNEYRIIFSPVKEDLSGLLSYFETASDFKTDFIFEFINDSSDKSSKIVRKAEKLVLEQYNNPIGVAQIAEQLNLTPNYLSTLFKKYKNISFTKFITDIRLNEAPALLETPGITVKEAASRLGYMSSRHFARLFREKYGVSPSDYRK